MQKYEIIDEMDKLVNDNYVSIKNTKDKINFKYFDSVNNMNAYKLKAEIDTLSSDGVVLFTQLLVSKVGQDRKKYVVIFENKNITIMISIDKKQITTTPVTDLIGVDMDGCDDFTEADLVCFVCKKETKLLSDNILGLECLDIYAYGSPPHDICEAFPAKDKQGRIRIVSSEVFEDFELQTGRTDKQIQINKVAAEFINDLEDKNNSNKNEPIGCGGYLSIIGIIIMMGMAVLHHFTGCTLHIPGF